VNGTNFDDGVLMRNAKNEKPIDGQKVKANNSCKTCATKTASVGGSEEERNEKCCFHCCFYRAKIKIKLKIERRSNSLNIFDSPLIIVLIISHLRECFRYHSARPIWQLFFVSRRQIVNKKFVFVLLRLDDGCNNLKCSF
jgi:hypothetical protein